MKMKNKLLLNVDFGFYGWNPEVLHPEGRPVTAAMIYRYAEMLAKNGVDTMVVNPNTQRAWYPSKVVPTVLDGYVRGDREYAAGLNWGLAKWQGDPVEGAIDFLNAFLELKEAGIDWLAETAKACRRYGVTPWASIRMNDMHGNRRLKGHYANCHLYDDERFRLKGMAVNPKNGTSSYNSALNYGMREVRDYMFSMIREIVEDYDYDGLELDFMRNPAICDPTATPETVAMISAWIGEIRALTEAKSSVNGRPYPLGLRVPGNIEMMKEIGLDVYGLIDAGLIDYICVADFVFCGWDSPIDEIKEHVAGRCAVYGVTEACVNRVESYSPKLDRNLLRTPYNDAEYLRGAAASQLALGADGIEVYNMFTADQDGFEEIKAHYELLPGIASASNLRGEPKMYSLSTATGVCWYPPFEHTEQLPATIDAGCRLRFRVPMLSEPDDAGLILRVNIVIDEIEDPPDIGVSFNNRWPDFNGVPTNMIPIPNGPITQYKKGHIAYGFTFAASLIKEGWNWIDVYNGSSGKGGFHIINMDIAVMR